MVHSQEEIKEAVKVAKSVENVILCIGLNWEWEYEGYDRSNMDLPPLKNDLVTPTSQKVVCAMLQIWMTLIVLLLWLYHKLQYCCLQ